jgi:hypothetical protein
MKLFKWSFFALVLIVLFVKVFIDFYSPSVERNGLVVDRNIVGAEVYSKTTSQCGRVALPFVPLFIRSIKRDSLWTQDFQGNKFLISAFSKEKKCKEVSVIRSTLTKYKIPFMEDLTVVNSRHVKPEVITAALKEINQSISFKPISKQNEISSDTPVKYIMYENGQIDEYTQASYGTSTPTSIYPVGGGGFDIFLATTFGLRAYFINATGDVVSEGGDYNTAFYSVTTYKNDKLFVSEPGHGKIFAYNKLTGQLDVLIDGYSATEIHIIKDKLYFVGYPFGKEWDKSSLYEYNLDTNGIKILTKPIFADVRGMTIYGDKLYISDGSRHRLVVLDANTFQVQYFWLGFNYPNGISITSKNTLLVADEHAGVIREIDLQTSEEIRSVGYGFIRSPSHVKEVTFGPYKGKWLIADADNNRLLLISPDSLEIIAEIGGLRSVFDFVVLPSTS